MITSDARCTREVQSRIAMAKEAFNMKTPFTSKLDLNLRKILALYGAGTWLIKKVASEMP